MALAGLLLAAGLFWGCSSSESNTAKAEPQKMSGFVEKVDFSSYSKIFVNGRAEWTVIKFKDGRVKKLYGWPSDPIPTGRYVTILYNTDSYGIERLVNVVIGQEKSAPAKKNATTQSS